MGRVLNDELSWGALDDSLERFEGRQSSQIVLSQDTAFRCNKSAVRTKFRNSMWRNWKRIQNEVDGNSIFLHGGIFQGKSRHNQVRKKRKFYGNEVVSTIGAVPFLCDQMKNRSIMRQPWSNQCKCVILFHSSMMEGRQSGNDCSGETRKWITIHKRRIGWKELGQCMRSARYLLLCTVQVPSLSHVISIPFFVHCSLKGILMPNITRLW